MFTREQLETVYKFPFKDEAVDVLRRAEKQATDLNHNYIGTEHLLLGYSQVANPVLMAVMRLELPKVKHSVELVIGRGNRLIEGQLDLTPRSRRVIEVSVDQAKWINDSALEADHIMLGLIGEGEGIAAGVLSSLGIELTRARIAVLETRQQAFQPMDRLRFFLSDPSVNPAMKKELGIRLRALADEFVPLNRNHSPSNQ